MTNRRMRYPDEVVERAKQDFDLVEAVSRETRLKRSGKLMSGRCPHPGHKDRDASFVVDPHLNRYHCYSTSCVLNERWFSPIDWMMQFRGAPDFNAAMEMLGGKREQLSLPVRRQMAEANKAKREEMDQQAQQQAETSKQWGEWAPWHHLDLHEGMGWSAKGEEKRVHISLAGKAGGGTYIPGDYTMYRLGKQRAGNLLDGRKWLQMPGGESDV